MAKMTRPKRPSAPRPITKLAIAIIVVLAVAGDGGWLAWAYDNTNYDEGASGPGTPTIINPNTNPANCDVWLVGSQHSLSCTPPAVDWDICTSTGLPVADSVSVYWTATSGTFVDDDNTGTSNVDYECRHTGGASGITAHAIDEWYEDGESNPGLAGPETASTDQVGILVVMPSVYWVGFENDHVLSRTPEGANSHAGWAMSTEGITDPIWHADSTENDKTNYACFTRGSTTATLKARFRVTSPLTEGSTFHLGADGTNSWTPTSCNIGKNESESNYVWLPLSDYSPMVNTVKRYTAYACDWEMFFYYAPNPFAIPINTTTHTVYLTFDTPQPIPPVTTARTVKRIDWVCKKCDGLWSKEDCTDAIFAALNGTPPPSFGDGEMPEDYWWAMDPAYGPVDCEALALLMQRMCALLGVGTGEIGYVYCCREDQSPPDTVYSTSDDEHATRICGEDGHGTEKLVFLRGTYYHQWQAVFVREGKYYAVKETSSTEPGDIMEHVLTCHPPSGGCNGINCACIGTSGTYQVWDYGPPSASCIVPCPPVPSPWD